ncbi:universal stress protein [Streptomyces hyaluromycini]|uniref:universal stress protein n=1 Tax=Streptomyces hyaluromycini TaxID=1377993 RepID=UPI000D1BA340|nr:universal stress protein [Streptomyces hyaluromycini]
MDVRAVEPAVADQESRRGERRDSAAHQICLRHHKSPRRSRLRIGNRTSYVFVRGRRRQWAVGHRSGPVGPGLVARSRPRRRSGARQPGRRAVANRGGRRRAGRRGRGGFARAPFGSVRMQVSQHASCPVVIVRPEGP